MLSPGAPTGRPVAPEVEIPRMARVGPLLRPDEIEHRSRPVFPAQDERAAQRFEVEVRIAEGKRPAPGRGAVGVDGVDAVGEGEGRAVELPKKSKSNVSAARNSLNFR